MPIVSISSLPPTDLSAIPRMIADVQRFGAKALQCEGSLTSLAGCLSFAPRQRSQGFLPGMKTRSLATAGFSKAAWALSIACSRAFRQVMTHGFGLHIATNTTFLIRRDRAPRVRTQHRIFQKSVGYTTLSLSQNKGRFGYR